MKYSQKGFTLVELLLTLSLIGIVAVVIFSFFISNLNNFKRNEINITLQHDARTTVEFISRELIGAKSIIEINGRAPNEFLNNGEVDVYSIVFSILEEKNDDGFIYNRKMIEIKSSEDGNKLSYGYIQKRFISNYTNMEVAYYIEKMKVKPILNSEDKIVGIIFILYFQKDDYTLDPIEISIYFRNHN